MNNYQGVSSTQMSINKSGQNNFNTAYQQNQQFIPAQEYTNNGQLIHNNVESNMLNENYIDYTIHVDSTDRNTSVYPNPYSFVLTFGGAGPGKNKYFDSHGNLHVNDYVGAPDPIIDKKFRNVKNVILDKIFFPRYIGFERTGTPGNYDYSGNVTLASRYRYVVVRIKELDNNRMFSTNNFVRDDSFVMYNDKTLGEANVGIWIASPYKRFYLRSALKNIDKFTIEIVDPKGNLIVPTYDDSGTNVPIPANDLKNENHRDQFEFQIHFILTVLENELNTKPNYR